MKKLKLATILNLMIFLTNAYAATILGGYEVAPHRNPDLYSYIEFYLEERAEDYMSGRLKPLEGRFEPFSRGCGTECYALMAVFDHREKIIYVLDSPVDNYGILPKDIVVGGNKLRYDGSRLIELK